MPRLLYLFWFLSVAGPAQGQWIDPRPRTHPLLMPASDIPSGVVRALAFGRDSAGNVTLYSAGEDKLVRRWSLAANAQGELALQPLDKILWPIYRDIRGVVYALDVGRDSRGDLLAFGGIGAKVSLVNWLPVERPQQQRWLIDDVVRGRNAVYALAYNPADSRQLAVGHDGDPHVLVWRVGPAANQPQHRLATGLTRVRYVAFSPDGNLLAIAGRTATAQWQIELWNPASGKPAEPPQVAATEITGLAWHDSRTWLAGTLQGIVTPGDSALRLQARLARGDVNPANHGQLRALAALPGRDPVVTIYDPQQRSSRIYQSDLIAETLTPLEENLFVGDEPRVVLAMTSHGDATYIAAGGQTRVVGSPAPLNTLRVWRAGDAKLLAQVPSAAAAQTAGAPIANVALLAAGDAPAIGFCWGPFSPLDQLPLTHRYGLLPRELTRLSDAEKAMPQSHPWSLRFNPQQPLHYFLVNLELGTKAWGPLPVWGTRAPRCCAVDANRKLLALGYGDGILICDLAQVMRISGMPNRSNEQKKLDIDATVLRSFYGHSGMVSCLAFSPDSSWLLSGSLDGTISAWSLQGMGQNELGVQVAWQKPAGATNSFATITSNPPLGSPGWEAGFRAGQQIRNLLIGGAQPKLSTWVDRLARPVPGREMLATVIFQGKQIDLYSTISHEPLWTFYPQLDGQWVLATPPGHFEVSSLPESLPRVEFHVNLGGDPVVQPGEIDKGSLRLPALYFQHRYLNSLAPGADSSMQRVSVLDRVIRQLRPDPPQEALLPPLLELSVNENRATLSARATGAEPIAELQLWLNGKLLAQREAPEGGEWGLSANVLPQWLRAGANQVIGVAGIAAPGGRVYSRVLKPLVHAAATDEARLHYVGVGVTALGGAQERLTPLKFSHHDVGVLGRALEAVTHRDGLFKAGFLCTLAATEARPPTEANVLGALKQLALEAGPNDVAIVFLAGHGVTGTRGFRFIAQDTGAAPDAGISDVTIEQHLSAIACRTLLILDTCHAEGVEIERQVLDWPGLQLGPHIIAACGTQQTSIEQRGIGFGTQRAGHGIFTAALLEPLLGQRCISSNSDVAPHRIPRADLDGDGRLTFEEWFAYARLRTPQLALRLPERPKDQQPTIVPSITFRDARSLALCQIGAKK